MSVNLKVINERAANQLKTHRRRFVNIFFQAVVAGTAGLLFFLLPEAAGQEAALLIIVPASGTGAILLVYHLAQKGFFAALALNFFAALATMIFAGEAAKETQSLMLLVIILSTLAATALCFWRKKELAGQQSLRWLSTTDPLTQVYNQRYFHQRLEEELSRAGRTRAPLSLAFIDLDYFKKYNDSFGHVLGDQALRKTAAFLNKETRLSDIVCRYGGDEFVIILPETSLKEARLLTSRLGQNFNLCKMPAGGGTQVGLSLSIGISAYPALAADLNELVRQADRALYMAKRKGRKQTVVYSAEAAAVLSEKEQVVYFESCEKKLTGIGRAMEKRRSRSKHAEDKRAPAKSLSNSVFFGRAIGLGHAKFDALKLKPYLEDLGPH